MTPRDVQTQIRAADALLNRGVLVDKVRAPFFLRIIGKRYIQVVFHHPTIETLVMYSEIVAQIGLATDDLSTINIDDPRHLASGDAQLAMEAMIVAAEIVVPSWTRQQTAIYLISHMKAWRFSAGWKFYLTYSGAKDFINTIRLMAMSNHLSPTIRRSQPVVV